LNAIHNHHNAVPEDVTVKELCDIAAITEYFQLQDAMDIFFQSWVRDLALARTYDDHPLEWLFLSMVFVKEGLFHDMAKRLITERQSSRPIVTDLPIEKRLLDDLHNQRETALHKLFSTLRQLRSRLKQDNRCSPRCSDMLASAVEETVERRVGHLNKDTITVNDVVRIFYEIRSVAWFRAHSFCGTSGREFCCLFDVLRSRGGGSYIIPVLSDYRPDDFLPEDPLQDPVESQAMDVDTETNEPVDAQNTTAQVPDEPASNVEQVASGDRMQQTETPSQAEVTKMKIKRKTQKPKTATDNAKKHKRGGRGERGGYRVRKKGSSSTVGPSA
jgi:hypothetical protein